MIRSAWRRQHGRLGAGPGRRWLARVLSVALALMLVLVLVLSAALPVQAHRGGESQLVLTVEGQQVHADWSIDLSDLALASAPQAPPADSVPSGGTAARAWLDSRPLLPAQTLARLSLSADGQPCPSGAAQHGLVTRPQGPVLVLRFTAHCARAPQRLGVGYHLLFDADPRHQGLLRLHAGSLIRPAVFTAESQDQVFSLQGASRWEHAVDDLRSGVWHIWTGWDHLLFLLCLVLPAVLARRGGNTSASVSASAVEVLKVVTAFTGAHSVTLSLAALQWISLPPRLVESVIAGSVVLAAVMNLQAVPSLRRWQAALAFGLVHGFGFASALGDMGVSGPGLVPTLIAFNLGVEVGQLAVVVTLPPLAYLLRRRTGNGPALVRTGSSVIVLLALLWLIERAFDLSVMPRH